VGGLHTRGTSGWYDLHPTASGAVVWSGTIDSVSTQWARAAGWRPYRRPRHPHPSTRAFAPSVPDLTAPTRYIIGFAWSTHERVQSGAQARKRCARGACRTVGSLPPHPVQSIQPSRLWCLGPACRTSCTSTIAQNFFPSIFTFFNHK
jgi:hypothetical protein